MELFIHSYCTADMCVSVRNTIVKDIMTDSLHCYNLARHICVEPTSIGTIIMQYTVNQAPKYPYRYSLLKFQ